MLLLYNPYQLFLQGLVVIFLFLQISSTSVGNKKLERFFWEGGGGGVQCGVDSDSSFLPLPPPTHTKTSVCIKMTGES